MLLAFRDYLQERFPLINGMLALIFFLTGYTFTSFLVRPDSPIMIDWRWVGGIVSVWSFLFKLRVMDEHKDYDKDLLHYPDRVLQSGRVTLSQLRWIAYIGTLLEAIISYLISPFVLLMWGMCLAYSLLMYKEFFVGKWLEKRLFLYALTHMLITPMIVLWIGSMALAGEAFPWGMMIELGLLSFFSGLAFEVGRKIRAPEDEVEGVQTYSQLFGYQNAPWVLQGCLLIALLINLHLLTLLESNWIFGAILVALWVSCVPIKYRFIQNPSSKGAKTIELGASVFMLLVYLLVILATLMKTGFEW